MSRNNQSTKRLRGSGTLAVLLIAILLLNLTGCGSKETPKPVLDTSFLKAIGETSYQYVSVNRGTLTVSCEDFGKNYFRETSAQLFSETEGKVLEILANTSDEIKEGDPIIRLDTGYSRAHLEDMKKELERMKKDYAVQEEVWQKKIVVAQTDLGTTISQYKNNKKTADEQENLLDDMRRDSKKIPVVSNGNGAERAAVSDYMNSMKGTLPGLQKDIEIGNIGLESQAIDRKLYELDAQKSIVDMEKAITRYEKYYGEGIIRAEQDGVISDLNNWKKGNTIHLGDRICTIRGETPDYLTVKTDKNALPYGMEIRFENPDNKDEILTGHVISSSELCPEANSHWGREENLSIIQMDVGTAKEIDKKTKGKWNSVLLTDIMMIPKDTVQKDKVNGTYVEVYQNHNIERIYIDCILQGKNYWVTGGLSGDERIILRNRG